VDRDVSFRIVLERPPAGIDFAVQRGRGSVYETILKQRSGGGDLRFEFTIPATGGPGQPRFTGPLAQGPAGERFVYIDIGACAGQIGTPWSRRLKIPLTGITWSLIDSAPVLEARIPGTGRDGGPSCASAWRPADGPGEWKPARE
jgi:hypothetical protein